MSDNKKTEKIEIYRYYVDLRRGSFIFVTKNDDTWPPPGYPVIRLMEEAVEKYLLGDNESNKQED